MELNSAAYATRKVRTGMTQTPSYARNLRVIDEGAAKRLWTRRTLDEYQIVAHKHTHEHRVYLDTPQHVLADAHSAVCVCVHNHSKQTIHWYTDIRDDAPPTISDALTSPQWPEQIIHALTIHDVAAHTLVPIIHVISKRQTRRLIDHTQQCVAELVLTHGNIYANGHHEAFCEIDVIAHGETTPHTIDALTERIQQRVPSMVVASSYVVRGLRFYQYAHAISASDDALQQHISMLQGTQRSGDDALFIPLANYDSPTHRMVSACARQLLVGVTPETEPFWLALDAAEQHHVTTLITNSEMPSYTIYGAELPLHRQLFSEGLRLQLRHHFRQMLKRRQHVLSEFDANHIHRMRVILRKIRALLECADGIYNDELLSQYKRGFRRMARFLGEVRDCDVLNDNIARICGVDTVAPEVTRAIAQTRQQALKELYELFSGIKHHRFIEEYAVFVCTPEAGVLPTTQDLLIGDLLSTRIAERVAAFQQPLRAPFERIEESELHAWRIRAKRLRYILECFPTVIIPASAPALAILDETQQHLGVMQDAVVAFELLSKMKLQSHPDSKKVITQLRQESQHQRQQLAHLWQQCTSSTFNDALFATITAIR